MRQRRASLLALYGLLAAAAIAGGLIGAACGDTGDAAAEEAYLRAFCTGLDEFSDALVATSDPGEIERTVTSFASLLGSLTPPPALREFQTRFIAYLAAVAAEPSSVAARRSPAPPSDVRRRVAAKAGQVDECDRAEYFRPA